MVPRRPAPAPARPVLPRWSAAALLLAAAPGCASVTYQPVDLQLDALGLLPDDAATLHLCVTGAGEHDQGAGNGRGVFTGLPVGATEVNYQLLDDNGAVLLSTGRVTFDEGVA